MTRILEIRDKCTGCMACYNICPENAISMQEDNEGFYMPNIDQEHCTKCILCEKVCPEINLYSKQKKSLIKKAYYGWHNNDDIRKKSSSGGAFTAMAENILSDGGVVFGAVYDANLNIVKHKSTDEVDLDSMRKSKYVQSYIGSSFQKVKFALSEGKNVLFVGTPCQIAGLENYIGYHKNLITCDFICHGVPSMKLLKDDFSILEKKYNSKVINFDFRPKVKTWSFDFFSMFFVSGKRKNIPWKFNSFFKAFNDNIILRKSCYRCNYSDSQHESDITIADYWGYRRYDEKIFDNKGLSLILINTNKGKLFFKTIDKEQFIINAIDWKYADYVFFERNEQNYNKEKRKAFFDVYNKYGYNKTVKKFNLKPGFKTRFLKLGVKIKRKIFRK